MAATTDQAIDLEAPNSVSVAPSSPANPLRPSPSAISPLSGSGGIRKSTLTMDKKKRTLLHISGPPPAHHLRTIYEQKIAALEKENNRLRNWWWVNMRDVKPLQRLEDLGPDTRWSEIYKREHWVRGMELAAGGWLQADFARERHMQADMRDKVREARRAEAAAGKAKGELAVAKAELERVRGELEERKVRDAVDRQLMMDLWATTQ